MHFSENLKYLRKHKKLSQQVLADQLDLPRTTLGDYERGNTEPSLAMLIRIAQYFDVSMDALLQEDISLKALEVIKQKHLKVLAISIDNENKENIELVDTKAEAGYLESFSDPNYIAELPKISIPQFMDSTYRAFEIRGDSMLPLESGSIVISSYVEKLEAIKDHKTYIIISQSQGVVYKRIQKDLKNQRLILSSDNKNYPSYSIPLEEVQEVWQHAAHLSFSDAVQQEQDHILYKIDDIQETVHKIKKAIKRLPSEKH